MKIKEPFSLEAYRNGAKVETRDGRAVRILCTDRKGSQPIVGLIIGDKYDGVVRWSANGRYLLCDSVANEDLVIVIETEDEENFPSSLPDFSTEDFGGLAHAQLLLKVLTNAKTANLFSKREQEDLKKELKRILLTSN